MDSNARGPFFTMQAFVRQARAHAIPASIVNIVSMVIHCGQSYLAPYSASKAALANITRNTAQALRAHRIRCNAIACGWMDTPGEDATQKAWHDAPDDWLAKAEAAQPFGQLVKPAEVAPLAAYLLIPTLRCHDRSYHRLRPKRGRRLPGVTGPRAPPRRYERRKTNAMTMTFGLLGAGRIGKVHARAISATPDAKLVAVADALAEAAGDVAARYGCAVRTIEEIEAAGNIDAVIICTPTNTHADLIERFAQRRQGDLLREADRPLARPREGLPEGGRGVRRETDGRLQPPLRPAFRRRQESIDEGRIGDGRDGADHLARPRRTARRATSSPPAASSAT